MRSKSVAPERIYYVTPRVRTANPKSQSETAVLPEVLAAVGALRGATLVQALPGETGAILCRRGADLRPKMVAQRFRASHSNALRDALGRQAPGLQ